MAKPQIQTSFAAGELSPSLYGHVDFAKFSVGAATSRNMLTNYRGGSWSRAGTAFVGFSKQTINNIASGSVVFPTNPTNGQTVTLNGAVFTFVTTGGWPGVTGNYEINIGVNAGGTMFFMVQALTAGTTYLADARLNGANYTDAGGTLSDTLVITWKSPGPSGNTYTLAADAPATVSGPTLSGGGSVPPRLLTFQFNLNQGLVLEFGQEYMRVIDQGAFVVTDSGSISAVSKASPATVTQNAHGYTTGFWWFADGCQGMTQLNGRTFIITVLNANQFTLHDVYGDPIDSTGYGSYSGGGTGSKIYELATPYQAQDLEFLKFSQSADVMSLCCINQETGVEYPTYDLRRHANDDWELALLDTSAGISPPTGAAAEATAPSTSGMGGMTDYQYVVTAISADTERESIASNIADEPDSVDISVYQGSIVVTWNPVASAKYYNIYKALPAVLSTVPDGALFGFCGQVFGQRFVDSNISADMLTVPPLHRNPFAAGAIVDVTMTGQGSSLIGPISTSQTGTVVVNTATGSGMTGYLVIEGGFGKSFVVTFGGEGYQPSDTITFSDGGGVKASGSIGFGVSGNPANGETVTLNGRVITFVTAPGGWPTILNNYSCNIGGSLGGTLFFLQQMLSSGTTYLADTLLNVADYSITATDLDIEYKTAGAAGNAYTLAASAANPGRSAATLLGGTGGIAPTGDLVVGATSGTFPGVVGYVQQRRVYANSMNNPDTYWMSQPGDFSNFDVRIPTIDSDAITGTPWSVQVDGIQFMIPLLGGIIMLTGQAAYQVMGQGGSPTNPQPITPSSQQALPQAFNGCHFHVPPVQIDYDIYYLQAKGSVIRSLAYNFWINVFTGVDITYLSSHLFSPFQIQTMSWCEEPFKLMWAVRSDGVMLCLTTVKSQEVMAWTRHDTQGLFAGSTSVIEPPVDALYLVTQRFFDQHEPFIIERMDNRLWDNVEQSWCVDCGLQYPQPTPNASIRIDTAYGVGTPAALRNGVGGHDYSQNTYGTVIDQAGMGSGCTVTLTVLLGVISNVSLSGGTGYRRPVIQFTDPDNTGYGASADILLDNQATCVADASVFSSGDVGSVIRCGGGIAQITHYTSGTQVTVQIISPILEVVYDLADDDRPLPFDPGQWTMTAPTTTVTGLWPLVGQTVTGVADGSVIEPQEVAADGTITLANPASAITVGLSFLPQLQSLYLVDDGGVTQQGRRKNIGAVTVRVESSGPFQLGTNQPDGAAQSPIRVSVPWTSMEDAATNTVGLASPPYGTAIIQDTDYVQPTPLFTGDIRVPVGGGFIKGGQVAVQQPYPMPLQVLAFIPESDVGDDPETGRGGQG